MNLVIKTYNPQFISDQVRIGKKVTMNWGYYSQSSFDELKQAYSRKEFNPKTKLYALDNDKVIGFITSKIIEEDLAEIAPPIVEDNDYEICTKLLQECINQLKNLGMKQIRITSCPSWGLTDRLVNDFKMKFDAYLLQEYLEDLDNFKSTLTISKKTKTKIDNTNLKIINYDVRYRDQVAEILSQIVGYDKTFAIKILSEPNQLPHIKEEISKILISESDQVLGFIRGSIAEINQEIILSLTPGYIISPEFYHFRKLLILSLFGELNSEVKKIRLIITKETQSQIEPLELDKLSLNAELKYYTKII